MYAIRSYYALGHQKGDYHIINPNDHVNFGQSTNDVYPTAFRLALILRLASYMDALRKLQGAFFAKAKEFERVLKMGRTHLQDAGRKTSLRFAEARRAGSSARCRA